MRSGALDFIQKPFSYQVLLQRIQQAIEKDRKDRTREAKRAEYRSRFDLLTRRERQVMHLVVEGKANKQIASQLGLSQKTIELHRSHVMKKLRAESLPGLVRIAMAMDVQG